MKGRALISTGCFLLCALAIAGAFAQHRKLNILRTQHEELRSRLNQTSESPAQTGSLNLSTAETTETAEADIAPSPALLRLRAEVTRLSNRKSELVDVGREHEGLRTELVSRGTNTPGTTSLPAGYIRKSAARFLGYRTPEATLETFLWAVRTHNATHLLQAFAPEAVKQMEQTRQQQGLSLEKMFEDTDALPGLLVIGRHQLAEDLVEFETQVTPDDDATSQKIRLQRIDGEWKLTEH